MSRQLSLQLGRNGPVQRFSLSRPDDTAVNLALLETLRGSTSQRLRDQLLNDPTTCFQFACVYGDNIGFLTRPQVVPGFAGGAHVLGSFSDTLGRCVPVAIPEDQFCGSFTTLMRRADAVAFGLTAHPERPENFRGPAPVVPAEEAPADPVPASLARLHFAGPDPMTDADMPVLVALPAFLPLGPGQTFPLEAKWDDVNSWTPAFPLFAAWCAGVKYISEHNEFFSVSRGGPIFHLPDLELADDADPFAGLTILNRLPRTPYLLPPTFVSHLQVEHRISMLSTDTWISLGSRAAEEAPEIPEAPPAGGLTADHIKAIVTPLVTSRRETTRELEQSDSAKDVALSYMIALAGLPGPGQDPSRMAIPTLNPAFLAVLNKTKPVVAAQALQEIIQGALEVALSSAIGLDVDTTFDAEACTTAFANAIRSFHWLTEPLARTSHVIAQKKLSGLHFLTPIRGALLASKASEAANGPVVLSHVSDDKAQLEASKTSQLYSSGRLEHGNDVYLLVCNLRLFFRVILGPANEDFEPLVLTKLLAYIKVLKSLDGRLWSDSHRTHQDIAVHLFQDIQHILGLFFNTAKRASLKNAIRDPDAGTGVAPENFWNVARTADSLIDRLRGIITGNGLGEFRDTPVCSSWFPKSLMATSPAKGTSSPAKGTTPPKAATPSRGEPDSKKPRTKDQSDIDRCKAAGILTYDAKVGGSTRLPQCRVVAKAHGRAKTEEMLCMKFMTRGFYCNRSNCLYPHITNLQRLGEAKAKDVTDFVKKTPGLSFSARPSPGTN